MCQKSLDYLLTFHKLVLDSDHNWEDLCIQSIFPNRTSTASLRAGVIQLLLFTRHLYSICVCVVRGGSKNKHHERHMCQKSLDYLLTFYKLVLDSDHNWANLCLQSTFPNWTPRVSLRCYSTTFLNWTLRLNLCVSFGEDPRIDTMKDTCVKRVWIIVAQYLVSWNKAKELSIVMTDIK